ncbi:SCO6745 family protein [Nocardioides bruguierae]|uniref:MarR family transcriptional regulator n=1 Tax=Nocardioides bruguierae TaxID=2945102 RepID=A0A9X2D4K2_9ACTN|nr:MarR family transcriptional regulator [Nocardioides bruguierae]MCM0619051.1 MarR family transcriptional regulator [Nocardioides bruguierae]
MSTPARALHDLLEPVHLVTYFSEEPTAQLERLGLRGYWDGYMAGRAAPLGTASAAVVHAAFYNFFPGEVARHVPRVWRVTTPEEALRARQDGAVLALRRILGPLADSPGLAEAADLATAAAAGAPVEGRVLSAALQALPAPQEPVARLWHAATVLREHRGDGHHAALVAHDVRGPEAHLLLWASLGHSPRTFGRVHHRPARDLDPLIARLQGAGLLDELERITDRGLALRASVEEATDAAARPAYDALGEAGVARLVETMAPITTRLLETGSR